jgi:hypothetical protein
MPATHNNPPKRPQGRSADVAEASAFELDFRFHVQPKLRRANTAAAKRFVRREFNHAEAAKGDFEAAVAQTMCLALRLGAGYLDEFIFADLYDWVITDLADAIEHELEA